MEYTPRTEPKGQPTPSYELKKDVTGKPPEKRGVYVLTDKNGTQVKLPYPPKNKCKHCYGRGYLGMDTITGKLVICRKCYPRV